MRPYLLVISLIFSPCSGIEELCFIRTSSTVRRDSVGVVSSLSQKACNIRCLETPGCDACMFYVERGKCVLLGAARAPPPGQCPAPYDCYAKTTSGCPAYSPPDVSRGYVPGPCSRASDVRAKPVPGEMFACGQPAAGTPIDDMRTVLDAILYDGTRMLMENSHLSFVDWDPYMGSWFYDSLNGMKAYFKCAACVHPPYPALSPACDCGASIPTQRTIVDGYTATSEKPKIRTNPVCTTSVQFYFKRARNAQGTDMSVLGPGVNMRDIYCAMGEWMQFAWNPSYEEYLLVGATCVN